jgi:hypothetical protein
MIGLRRSLRWPLIALGVVCALIAVAFGLDAGPPAGRDAALLIGAPAIWILLPLTGVWLVVAALRHLVRTRRPGNTGPGGPRGSRSH